MVEGVEILGPVRDQYEKILTEPALKFIAGLHRQFNPTRQAILQRRAMIQEEIRNGWIPGFPEETRHIREGDWSVGSVPKDLMDRRVEITGPVDRKMIINALNSGAKMFMADFEDSNSPTWQNVVEGQLNLIDAIERRISFTAPNGKHYALQDEVATLIVRPRGWHLDEKHILVDGQPLSGSVMDFGLYFFHNVKRLLEKETGPYFYLPKVEGYLEARLWNDVFIQAQRMLDVEQGTIKATVLIETITAALEMEEILYELREHIVGLNAGRWDYIFSVIKKFRDNAKWVLPDRIQVSMTVPFMRAYTEQLVKTCHRRGAHAMGGMAAFIPSRRDAEVNRVALEKVREDKVREATDGFDGTWVAHPDLVPIATEVFDSVLGSRPNQVDKLRPDVYVTAEDLLNFSVPGGAITEHGVRNNVSVALQYIESWLRGLGAVAIYNLMEDAATAEISRAQIWQWVKNGVTTSEGRKVTAEWVRMVVQEELNKIRATVGEDQYRESRFDEAVQLFEAVALSDDFAEFLTIPAYQLID